MGARKKKELESTARGRKPIDFFFRTPPPNDQALAFSLISPFFSLSNSSQLTHSERKQLSLEIPAGVTAAAGAMLASPLAASAEVTPSLKNLINSVVAGGVVLVAIVVAVTAVSGFDPVTRK